MAEDPATEGAQEEIDDYREPAWHEAPWVLAAIVAVLVILALIFVFSRAAATGEGGPEQTPEVEKVVLGTWKSYGAGAEFRVIFRTRNRFELRSVTNYSVLGDWETVDDERIAATVDWRDYSGTWYFEPITSDQMRVQVAELGYDLTFYKVR
jgi:hypothetical protein